MTWWADGFTEAAPDYLPAMQAFTHRLFGERWVTQTVANARMIGLTPPVSALSTLAGVPGVVVSPGPSLSRNGHLLRQAKGRAIICASSHCLSTLAELGVIPDLVVHLDAAPSNHFDYGRLEDCGGLVVCGAADPATFSLPFRRRWVFSGSAAADGWLMCGLGEDGCSFLPSGGCVAGAQLSLLLQAGCTNVVLVGQDLSLADDGSYYAAQCHDHETRAVPCGDGLVRAVWMDGETEVSPIKTLPGYYGGTVRTTAAFSAYHAWFEYVAGRMAAKGHPLANCTEGGAAIRGAQRVSFGDWLGPWPTTDIRRRLFAAEAYPIGARASTLRGWMRKLVADLARIEALSQVCYETALDGDTDTLTRVEGHLRGAIGPLALPLSAVRGDEFIVVQERMGKATTEDERLDAATPFYLLLRGGAGLLRAALEEAS